MPTRTLDTIAVMYTITPEALQRNGIDPLRVPGIAARRRARGDRTAAAGGQLRPRRHRRGVHRGRSRCDGLPTIFVYDGYPGGAGFAERGFRTIEHLVGGHRGGDRGLRMPDRAARRACSRPSAATAMTRWTRHGAVRVLRLVLERWRSGAAESTAMATDPSTVALATGSRVTALSSRGNAHRQRATNGRTTRSVLNPGEPGAAAKYLVGRGALQLTELTVVDGCTAA